MLFFMEILLVAPVVQAMNAILLIRSRDASLLSNVAMSVTTILRQPGAMTRPDAFLRTTTVFENGPIEAHCTPSAHKTKKGDLPESANPLISCGRGGRT